MANAEASKYAGKVSNPFTAKSALPVQSKAVDAPKTHKAQSTGGKVTVHGMTATVKVHKHGTKLGS